jgi:DNA polymerase III epsilon subunit-like protein
MATRNDCTLLVFDTETGSLDVATAEILSIAAVAIDPQTLERVPNGEFYSLMRPENMANVQDGALAVNKLTRAELAKAPPRELVWRKFVDFVRQQNPKGRSPFTAPIACGKNIRAFDLPLCARLCAQYGDVDKAGRPNIFNQRWTLDLEDFLWLWFESRQDLPSYKLDDVREYMGLSKDGAHSAITDAQQTADLIVHFLRLHRRVSPKVQFKNSLAGKVTA